MSIGQRLLHLNVAIKLNPDYPLPQVLLQPLLLLVDIYQPRLQPKKSAYLLQRKTTQ
jgi:hypothetical protein